MHDRLNFFEPWEGIPAYHENQLTRALLVVLRCCPIAHQAWLSLIDPNLTLHSLPHPHFDTQRGTILENESPPILDDSIKGISVFCSADISGKVHEVQKSERRMVLDGIIRYDNDLVIILESKLNGLEDCNQARHINLHGQPVAFLGSVREISWRDVLATFIALADKERSLIAGAERKIVVRRDPFFPIGAI